MNNANSDKGKSASNLQKLFSSHVLETNYLKRQKSGLDNEKKKKFKELSNNEQLFLRKYDKYVSPGNRGRRCSIDAELARAIETNYNSRNRPSSSANKSFAKDSISDECPYSLESWNKLVDSEKSIIDENKQEILFGDDNIPENNNNSGENTDMILDEMFKANISLLESGKRLQRRQTLKPIETTRGNFTEDTVDEEILEIQMKQKRRGRRHSVALGALYGGQLNRESAFKLPSISEKNGVLSKKNIFSSDENIPFSQNKVTKKGRKLSMVDARPEINVPSPVPEIKQNTENKVCCGEKDANEHKSVTSLAKDIKEIANKVPNITINDKDEVDSTIVEDMAKLRKNTPRPVANATIFVQQDPIDDKSSIFDPAVRKDDKEKPEHSEFEQKQQPRFLPTIEVTNSDEMGKNLSLVNKHISVIGEEDEMRDRSDSDCSKLTTDSEFNLKKRGRRNSMATTTLKLLVDSHHGAAKLRYIARLAREMEKEEIAKHTPEPEPDIFEGINDCRYLRVVSRKESAKSRDSYHNDVSNL